MDNFSNTVSVQGLIKKDTYLVVLVLKNKTQLRATQIKNHHEDLLRRRLLTVGEPVILHATMLRPRLLKNHQQQQYLLFLLCQQRS
jgi:hypothetical protein